MKVKTFLAAAAAGSLALVATACGAVSHSSTDAAMVAPRAVSGAAPAADSAPADSARPATVAPATVTPAAKHYANCTALHQRWPHGVGRKHAVDHVRRPSDKPVTNFHRSKALYLANQRLDRDHDTIACEQH
jgi:Excalibur calcium-binding domain